MRIVRAIKSYRLKKKVSNWTDREVDRNIVIKNTHYDRKRKLSDWDIKQIKKKLKKGASIRDLASEYYVDPRTIRYALDPNYRSKRITQSNGKHYGPTCSARDRVRYKRALVAVGAYVK